MPYQLTVAFRVEYPEAEEDERIEWVDLRDLKDEEIRLDGANPFVYQPSALFPQKVSRLQC